MTSTVAPVNWTANGTDMVDVDGICLHTLVRGGPGETPQTRGEPILIPARPGLLPSLWERDHRTIEFRGWVRGTGSTETDQQQDFYDNKVTLATVLDPTAIIALVLTMPGGAQYTINARPMPLEGAFSQVVPSFALASVEFESYDPDWVPVGS